MTDATVAPKPRPPLRLPYLQKEFPYILRTREKHDDRFFLIASKEDLLNALRTLYNQRAEDGYWYEDKDKADIAKAFTDAAAFAAKNPERLDSADVELYVLGQFLQGRSDYEYERVDTEHFSTIQNPPKPVHVTVERDIIFLGK